jgi:hypothetical protein
MLKHALVFGVVATWNAAWLFSKSKLRTRIGFTATADTFELTANPAVIGRNITSAIKPGRQSAIGEALLALYSVMSASARGGTRP